MFDFSIKKRLKSFTHALHGAGTLVSTQHNTWIHAVATVLVLGTGFWFRVSLTEWALLTVAIVLAWLAEAFNTAIEFLADEVTLERRERIRIAKDVAAFGVLLSAIAAATIGAVIFLPHLHPLKTVILP